MPCAFAPSPTLAAAVRAHCRLTQAELAHFSGVSRPMIAAVEAGRKEFSDAPRRPLARRAALTPVVTALPAGKSRDMQPDELRRKTNRRDELVSHQGKFGPERLVGREFEQALLPPQVVVAQDLIAQVTAHRATLTS